MKFRLLLIFMGTFTTGSGLAQLLSEPQPMSLSVYRYLDLSQTQREKIHQLLRDYKESGGLADSNAKAPSQEAALPGEEVDLSA